MSPTDEISEDRFVEVLTSAVTGNVFGYRFGGDRPGPNALVAGYGPDMEHLFERLAELPTLPWMWGKLYLITLDALDEEYTGNLSHYVDNAPIDDMIMVPLSSLEGSQDHKCDESYWATLRLCTKLGMLSGRGIVSHDTV